MGFGWKCGGEKVPKIEFSEGSLGGDPARLKRVVAEQVQFALGIRMPANWDVTVQEFDYRKRIGAAFRMFLIGCEVRTETVKTENVPASLWSHVLLKNPWLRRLFGAPRMRSIATEMKHWHVCPHIATPDQRRHVEFLIMKE